MKLTLASRSQNYIRAYEAGEIRLAGQSLRTSCLIAPEEIIEHWTRSSIDTLNVTDLQPIFALKPEVVILGTGMRQQFPAAAIRAAFLARAIGFEVMDMGAACRTFNVLLSEDRRVVAAMILSLGSFATDLLTCMRRLRFWRAAREPPLRNNQDHREKTRTNEVVRTSAATCLRRARGHSCFSSALVLVRTVPRIPLHARVFSR